MSETIAYMLARPQRDGTYGFLLGGGSSTKAQARVYATREQAEYQSTRLREKGPLEVAEIVSPAELERLRDLAARYEGLCK